VTFTQLNPPIPLHVLNKGSGYAVAVIDYGQEHNLIWVTAISATGEIWCAPNPQVRMEGNWTMGRARNPLTRPSNGVGGNDCSGEAAPLVANGAAA
jgi:hypothetical protein